MDKNIQVILLKLTLHITGEAIKKMRKRENSSRLEIFPEKLYYEIHARISFCVNKSNSPNNREFANHQWIPTASFYLADGNSNEADLSDGEFGEYFDASREIILMWMQMHIMNISQEETRDWTKQEISDLMNVS